ncbi:MAG: hypothetical protein WHS88_10890 [Anaerohalosphaeraceae bacterium]
MTKNTLSEMTVAFAGMAIRFLFPRPCGRGYLPAASDQTPVPSIQRLVAGHP